MAEQTKQTTNHEQSNSPPMTSTPVDDSENSKSLENLSDSDVICFIETELKKSQQIVKSKLDNIDKSLNGLYCKTLESIMKMYKSNKSKSSKKPWEEFREAADHLSEMHKYMKTELVELYAFSQRRGSLACSRALLDSLCPLTTTAALPPGENSDSESQGILLQKCIKRANPVSNCKTRYVSRALVASQIKFDCKNSGNLKRVAPDELSAICRGYSPECYHEKQSDNHNLSGLVDSSSDDEDELLENEIKRRRTDHEWR